MKSQINKNKEISNGMKKRILIFSTAYFPLVGGAEIAVKEITDRISDIEFHMVTAKIDSSFKREEKIGNVNVYRVGNGSSLDKFLLPIFGLQKALSLNKKNKYNATWSIMASYAGFTALFFKLLKPKVKFILTLQEGDPIEEIKNKVKYIYPIFKKIFQKADIVQAISIFLGNWAKEMGGKHIEIISNGVDIKNFQSQISKPQLDELKNKLEKKEDDKFLITASRLVKKNAVDDIIKSLKYLPKEIKLLVAGVGEDLNALQNLTSLEDLQNRVMFLGQVDHLELPRYLKISDIFIRPSLSEGMGNSFLEAMAAEIPVIATEIGGIPDFLRNKETGLFCYTRDPESIAEKVNILLADNEFRDRIVKNAKEMVEKKYDWDTIAKIMEEKIFSKV